MPTSPRRGLDTPLRTPVPRGRQLLPSLQKPHRAAVHLDDTLLLHARELAVERRDPMSRFAITRTTSGSPPWSRMRSAGRNSTRVGVRGRISTQLRCAQQATASPKLEPRVLVEPGKWLVEHDHAAGVVHRPRQRHAALHAAGELGDGLVQAVRRENLAQLLGELLFIDLPPRTRAPRGTS